MTSKFRLIGVLTLAFSATMLTAGSASATQKAGCQAADKVSEMSVDDVAATVWPGLLDQSAWTDESDFLETAIRPADRNGDGSLCLGIQWGEDLNPNSHWHRLGVEILGSPTELFSVKDNNRGATEL